MTTEFTVNVPGVGKVEVDRQDSLPDDDVFWDLFLAETGECLNEGNPFWTCPTEQDVLNFLAQPT